MTPTAVFPDPYHCARHFDCSQVTWHKGLRAKQSECRYPLLYDVNTTMCTTFDAVTCGNREEPIQPCECFVCIVCFVLCVLCFVCVCVCVCVRVCVHARARARACVCVQ